MKNDKEVRKKGLGSEVYHDPVDDQNYEKSPSLVCKVSLKYYWKHFLFSILSLSFIYSQLSKIPQTGLRIYDILGHPPVSKASSKMWLNFLSTRFSSEQISYPLYFIGAIIVLLTIYWILEAKTTVYSLNFRFLEIKKGVFNQKIGTIDLIHIKDQDMSRPLIHRIIGLSDLIIVSNDKTTPELFMNGIDQNEAEEFLNFIRQNAYQSSTEYWIAKDRRRRNEKNGKINQDQIIVDDKAEGEGDQND